MSRRDLQDEFKQTEGDPFLKARPQSLRLERARRRIMAEVPKATVVVTNPSHVAVALRYDATMAAPRLIAKGMVRWPSASARAHAHGVPIVRNPPLARALTAPWNWALRCPAPIPRGRRGDRLRAAPQTPPLTYRGTHPRTDRPSRNRSFTALSLPSGPSKRLRSRPNQEGRGP